MKTVIFDFDGTLADTRGVIVRTMQQTLAELGLPARSDAACAATIGLPLRQTFTQLMPMDEATSERCAATYHRLFDLNNTPGAVPLFPHVVETLLQLHQRGISMAVASSRSRQSLLDFIADFHLQDVMQAVVSADDITHPKPHPEPVVKILWQLDAQAEDALVVGDTTFDIGMGRSAGCATCGVTYGNHSRAQLQEAQADYIIDDFAQLTSIVLS